MNKRVVIIAFDGVQPLDITGPHEVFAGAARLLDGAGDNRSDDGYVVHVVATAAGVVRGESGLGIAAVGPDDLAPGPIDTLVIPGGDGVHAGSTDTALLALIDDLAGRARRVVTVCTGTFLAAAAGLLDERTVTTHWARASRLAATYPQLTVDADPIFIRDGDVWSSAGVTAGIDLALALVEDDYGAEIAQIVARWLVMFLRRPGGQSQFAAPVWLPRAEHGAIRRAQEVIDADPAGDHRVGVLAAKVAMSERHFLRQFSAEVGTSPGRYVAEIRLDAARRALEETDDSVGVVARNTGFGTAETMRRTFVRRLGTPPDQYRRRFRTHPAA